MAHADGLLAATAVSQVNHNHTIVVSLAEVRIRHALAAAAVRTVPGHVTTGAFDRRASDFGTGGGLGRHAPGATGAERSVPDSPRRALRFGRAHHRRAAWQRWRIHAAVAASARQARRDLTCGAICRGAIHVLAAAERTRAFSRDELSVRAFDRQARWLEATAVPAGGVRAAGRARAACRSGATGRATGAARRVASTAARCIAARRSAAAGSAGATRIVRVTSLHRSAAAGDGAR
jgi:hypothetical protein